MHIRIGLTNSEIVTGDDASEEQIQAEIDLLDGYIGNGDFQNVRVENVEDVMALFDRTYSLALNDLDTGVLTVRVNGEDVDYKSREVAWVRVVR